MVLPLPPAKMIRYDEPTQNLVYDALTSVIAGHPQAVETYTFYEEINNWLGPWGDTGYPIAYGKFYNVAFTTNQKLMANPLTKQWVWRTTILLQEAIRDFIMVIMRRQMLGAITEPVLRKAAFDSHPTCYTQAGLDMVALTAPELIPVIALIPGKEFLPGSPNFGATISQVVATVFQLLPGMTGNTLGALAGPAHTGILRRAVQQDQQRMLGNQRLAQSLTLLKAAIERGEVDNLTTLQAIVQRLNATQYPDQGFATLARQVVAAAELRQKTMQIYYRDLLQQSPEVKKRFDAQYPQLLRPPIKIHRR